MKTFAGDQLAGKLDTAEWKLVLFFTFGCMAPWVYFASGSMGRRGERVRAVREDFADFGSSCKPCANTETRTTRCAAAPGLLSLSFSLSLSLSEP